MTHPALTALVAAADGRFPPVDGVVEHVAPTRPGVGAVLSFTGHAYVLGEHDPATLPAAAGDAFGGVLGPEVLLALAGPDGLVHVTDATMVARGTGCPDALPRRDDLATHPRVGFAQAIRTEVRVFGDERGLVTLSRGLAGRTELSVETPPDQHGRGIGRTLIADALGLVPAGEPVFAAVSPGNARSLRAFAAVGFRVIGSECIIEYQVVDAQGVPHEQR